MYVVDRCENDYVIIQDLKTKNVIEIKNSMIKNDFNEGDVLLYNGNFYEKNDYLTIKRKKEIMDKLNKLNNN